MGLSSSQTGMVLAARPFVALVATPLWSAFADKSGRRDFLMLVCGALAFATFMLYAVVYFGYVAEPWRFSFIMLVRILNAAFSSPVYTMIAASCIDSFSSSLERRKFGRDRLWGAVSWGGVHIITGHIIDAMHGSFFILFPAAVVSFIIFFNVCRMAHQPFTPDASQSAAAVPMDSTPTENERDTDALVANFGSEAPAECAPKQAPRDASVFRILRVAAGTIFGSVASVVFFANLFFINIGTNVVEGLVFMFFKNELGASSAVLGWSVVVTVIFEIPLMYRAPQLLKRFETGTLIIAAELAYSLRTLVYTLMGTNTWILLFVEPLHGVTYSLLATSTTEHVASIVSPGLQTSAQSLISVIGGVAGIVGNACGGWIMQTFGSNVLYRTTSVMVLCSAILFLCFSAYRKSKMNEKNNEGFALQ